MVSISQCTHPLIPVCITMPRAFAFASYLVAHRFLASSSSESSIPAVTCVQISYNHTLLLNNKVPRVQLRLARCDVMYPCVLISAVFFIDMIDHWCCGRCGILGKSALSSAGDPLWCRSARGEGLFFVVSCWAEENSDLLVFRGFCAPNKALGTAKSAVSCCEYFGPRSFFHA